MFLNFIKRSSKWVKKESRNKIFGTVEEAVSIKQIVLQFSITANL